MNNTFLIRLPAIIFAIVIFVLSQIPGNILPPKVFDLQDKLVHLIIYFLFGISLSFATSTIENKRKRYFLILLLGACYALFDEIHQLYVPGRSCDFFDFIFDSFGVSISLFFDNKIRRFLKKHFRRFTNE